MTEGNTKSEIGYISMEGANTGGSATWTLKTTPEEGGWDIFGKSDSNAKSMPKIKKVIFHNEIATEVIWMDGTKTKVEIGKGDVFSPIEEKMKIDKELLLTVLGVTLVIIIVILSILNSIFQFNLCYPNISDSFWYCFQHAT